MNRDEATEFLELGDGDDRPRIPDVQLLSEIGRGGMGVVYRGEQGFIGRQVAVKVLGDNVCAGPRSPQFRARFQREAKILAAMTHPNIVSCYQAGTTSGGQCYLVMEFIDGPNLKQWIEERGPLSTSQALHLCLDLARALSHAHDAQIIHRDVKPENVLLRRREKANERDDFPFEVKLADLGLARSVDAESGHANLTMQGQVFGTPTTMSPEQFDDPDNVDHRTDIYGLGCVLFQALTAKVAFGGRTIQEIVAKKQATISPDPRKLKRTIPDDVARLVRDMLAYRREDRPQTYRDLMRRCEELLRRHRGDVVARPRRGIRLAVAGIVLAGFAATGLLYLFPPAPDPTTIHAIFAPAAPREGQLITLSVQGDRVRRPHYIYQWRQLDPIGATAVVFDDPIALRQEFRAPPAREDYELRFELRIREAPGEDLRAETIVVPVTAIDDPPIVTASVPEHIDEGRPVRLEAEATDLDTPPEALVYIWREVPSPDAPRLELDPDGVVGRTLDFTAPDASADYRILLELQVQDGVERAGTRRSVVVPVTADNDPPRIGRITRPSGVEEGDEVSLTVEVTDEDSPAEAMEITWRQTALPGEPELNLPAEAWRGPTLAFVAPSSSALYDLHLEVNARDGSGRLGETRSLTLTVAAQDDDPRARLVAPAIVRPGETLDLTAEIDNPDGKPLGDVRYAWRQIEGTPLSPDLSAESGKAVSRPVPSPRAIPERLGFDVTVASEAGSSSDTVWVYVSDADEIALVDETKEQSDLRLRLWQLKTGGGMFRLDGTRPDSPSILGQDADGTSSQPIPLPRGAWTLGGEIGPKSTGLGSRRRSVERAGVFIRLSNGSAIELRVSLETPAENGSGTDQFLAEARFVEKANEAPVETATMALGTAIRGRWSHEDHLAFRVEWNGEFLILRWGTESSEPADWTRGTYRPERPPDSLSIFVHRGSSCFCHLTLSSP